MKKIEISAIKGYFKEFNSEFMSNDIRNRVTYKLWIDKTTHEQNIIFIPKNGDEISKEDFKTLMSIIP
ncbi:MAG: hypothetical protein RSA74_13275 [Chryseobacterium sp.]